MNVETGFRQQRPELYAMLVACDEYLVKCADCPAWMPPEEAYHGGDRLLCSQCFDANEARRRDDSWAEWWDRVAKEEYEYHE